jgi:hypothetical protein
MSRLPALTYREVVERLRSHGFAFDRQAKGSQEIWFNLYRAWITNLPLTSAGVWHFYDGRAGMETRIRELREDYALRKIPTRAFAANALYLEVIRLAYNLVTAFQRTCLPEQWQTLTLSKLRYRLFWLPGELTRPQNRPILRLANSSAIQGWTEQIPHRVHKLKPLND